MFDKTCLYSCSLQSALKVNSRRHGDTVISFREASVQFPEPGYYVRCIIHNDERCFKSMQSNQPDPDMVVKRLRWWLNAGIGTTSLEHKHLRNRIPLHIPDSHEELLANAPVHVLPAGL